MKTLPLFPKPTRLAVQDVAPIAWHKAGSIPINSKRSMVTGPGCQLCTRAKKRTGDAILPPSIHLFDKLDKTKPTMLVVWPYADYGASHSWLADRIKQRGWKGNVIFDAVTRCGEGDPTPSHVEKCRAYLAQTFQTFKPTHILCCTARAWKAVTGWTAMVHANPGCYQFVEAEWGKVTVVGAGSPGYANVNRFYAQQMDEAIDLLLELGKKPMPAPSVATVRVVQNVEDCLAMRAALTTAANIVFDTETYGKQYNNDFELLTVSLCDLEHPDETWCIAYEFMRHALVRDTLFELLGSGKHGLVLQNAKYDMHAIWCGLGFDVSRVAGDTMLKHLLRNTDGAASLEELGQLVGIGAHKQEMDDLVAEGCKHYLVQGKDKSHLKAYAYKYALEKDPDVFYRYAGLDVHVTGRFWQQLETDYLFEPELEKTWLEKSLPSIVSFYKLEKRGFTVDPSQLQSAGVALESELERTELELSIAGLADPASQPTVVRFLSDNGVILIDETDASLKRGPSSPLPKTFSVDKKALVKVQDQHESVPVLLDQRQLSTLVKNYVTALPKHIRDDGKIHVSTGLGTTRTGRTSAQDPNYHSTPKRGPYSKLIKSCYRASPGYVLYQSDFKTLEIFIAAMWSQDPRMLDVLSNENLDFHTETTKSIAPYAWKMTADAVEAEILSGKKDKRDAGKTTSFAVLYQQGKKSLAQAIKTDWDTAQNILDGFAATYQTLTARLQEAQRYARRHGFVWSEWCGELTRRRMMLDSGFSDFERSGHADRAAANMPIQSSASDFCLASMPRIDRAFEEERLDAYIVGQVHDSIIGECRPELLARVKEIVIQSMTDWPTGRLKLRVDFDSGPNWAEC